jgi:hypothetical protein
MDAMGVDGYYCKSLVTMNSHLLLEVYFNGSWRVTNFDPRLLIE